MEAASLKYRSREILLLAFPGLMPLKKSELIHTRSLTIPSSTNIKDYEVEYVVKTIKEIT